MADQANGGQGNDPLYRCYPGRHAAGDERGFPDGNRHQPEHHLHPVRLLDAAPHLHRRARLAQGSGAEFPRLLHRQVDRREWRRTLRRARGRDALRARPAFYDGSGLPFHADDQATFKERFYLDRANPDILHDEITTFDHALTRPWTVTRSYQRTRNPIWFQNNCVDDNQHVQVGKEDYFIGADGLLMPVRKGQARPDLRHFE